MRTGGRGQPSNRLRWIIGVALGLAALHVILALLWGRGDFVAVLTWYVPMIHSFLALAAASIAFIAFGRYQVLREPAPYWIGMAFVSYSILALFYVLSWPGLLPDERGLITQLSNTAAWIFDVNHIVLAILLLLAVLVPWPRAGAPGEHWWAWLVLANSLATALFGSLSVAFEQYIPTLVVDSVFTPFQVAAQSVMLLAFSAGVLLSTRRYSETGDPLLGYLAITQLALAFSALTAIIGEARYDTWWYWRRLLLVAGFSTMLFGLLSEYVGLYRREREKTIQLETLLRVTDPALAQHGLEMLLQALLEQMVTIMGAHAGVILLLDPEQHELVLRKQLGVAEEQALGFRVRVGENVRGACVRAEHSHVGAGCYGRPDCMESIHQGEPHQGADWRPHAHRGGVHRCDAPGLPGPQRVHSGGGAAAGGGGGTSRGGHPTGAAPRGCAGGAKPPGGPHRHRPHRDRLLPGTRRSPGDYQQGRYRHAG